MVSTRLGAEGLDAIHDRHLLLGDTAAELAASCVELLRNEALRRRLTQQAHQLFRERFRWPDIRRRIVRLALATAGPRV